MRRRRTFFPNAMQNNKLTILAINPGTRYIGIAVLKGSVLIDWSIKVISGKLSPSKRLKMSSLIDRLIDEYEPDIISLKKLNPSRSSNYLSQLCSHIETTAVTNGIIVARYSIGEVERFFVPGEQINKLKLAELVCQRHPVLHREMEKERNNLNPYYIRMFEAVALGTMMETIIKN
jgi:Holliday junction resolvasome RuvABC endonuclease subunit